MHLKLQRNMQIFETLNIKSIDRNHVCVEVVNCALNVPYPQL